MVESNNMIMTDEDFTALMDSILFPIILSILERDIKKLQEVDLKIPMVYIGYLRKVQDSITQEMTELRKEMRKLGIKIYEDNKTEGGREYKVKCRGYQHTFGLFTDNIRTKVITRLCEILDIDLTKYGEV